MASERAIKASVDLWAECQSTSTSEEWDEAVVKVIDAALKEEREEAQKATAIEAAKVARDCMNFTGSGYCDVMNPANRGKQMHDYGRGGCDAQRVIVRDICSHFNISDEAFDAAMEAKKND